MKSLPKIKGIKKVNKTISFLVLNPDYVKKETTPIYLVRPRKLDLDLKCIIKHKNLVVSNISRLLWHKESRNKYKYTEFGMSDSLLHISSNDRDFAIETLKKTYLFGLPLVTLLMDTKNKHVFFGRDDCDIFIHIPDLLKTYKEHLNEIFT